MRMLVGFATLLTLVSLACDNNVGPLKSNVQVSFATRNPAAAPAPARAPSAWQATSNDTVTDGTNTIVITKAQVVLRKIELKPVQTTLCGSGTSGGCPEVELGPVLVDLPLTPGAPQQFSVHIPPGAYGAIDFEVHKVDTSDPAGLQSVLLNRSIHVEGTYNGQAFTFESELDVEQELLLSPALVVADTTTLTNVTVQVALNDWFRSLSGGTLLDPRDVANRSEIENAIKDSLKAFKDDDHDGVSDP